MPELRIKLISLRLPYTVVLINIIIRTLILIMYTHIIQISQLAQLYTMQRNINGAKLVNGLAEKKNSTLSLCHSNPFSMSHSHLNFRSTAYIHQKKNLHCQSWNIVFIPTHTYTHTQSYRCLFSLQNIHRHIIYLVWFERLSTKNHDCIKLIKMIGVMMSFQIIFFVHSHLYILHPKPIQK